MKIGIISDIHAYLHPLNVALTLFEREGVDQILCAGDLVDGGDFHNEVIQRISELAIPCVKGNHDDGVLTDPWWQVLDSHNTSTGKYRLTRTSYDYLVNLPDVLRFEWEGKKICLAHGTPWNHWEYIYHFAEQEIVHRVVDEAQSDIVILGHTHIPMQLRCGETYILNAGSVAMNRGPLRGRSCGILTIPNFSFKIHYLGTQEIHSLETQIIP